MRIHDRYVLGLFLRTLALCAVSFAVVFVLGDVFEKIDNFIDHSASAATIARFYLYKLPDILRLTLPVDLLLATIFTLGVLGKNNEIVALVGSGVSLLRLSLPILVVAGSCAGLSALLSERIVPHTNARMLAIRRVEIEKRPPVDAPVRHDFTYRGDNGYLYYARLFNVEAGRLNGVVVHQYRNGRLVARLDAQAGEWRDGYWEFRDGFYRVFAAEHEPGAALGNERAQQFHSWRLGDLVETPADLARIQPEPEAMSFPQLRRHVDKVRQSGGSVNDYIVDLYAKITAPFTNIVLALLGVALSATKRKSGLATGFGLTLVICFFYLVVTEVGNALGKNEALPPAVAAALGPALFGGVALALLPRVNR